jgi:hypothetical protein
VRFLVIVHQDWTVTVDGPVDPGGIAAPPRLWPHAGSDTVRLWPATGPEPAPDATQANAFVYQLYAAGASPSVPDLYDKIFVFEQYIRQDVEQLGGFLFDRLLGLDAWNAVRAAAGASADVIELALRFDCGHDLHRFPWELLHGPDGFLAQGTPAASVTRLVTRSAAAAPAGVPVFQAPPRVLFAVGASLTDQNVRPGAEVFGLLRQINARGVTVNTRVLREASPADLRDAVRQFQPDLVHITCHGDIAEEAGVMTGRLQFKSEDKKGASYLNADRLLAHLRFGGRVPPVIVLSACYSGAAPAAVAAPAGTEDAWRTAGADRIGSLAAQMVAGGVPVVVGMGGRVADSACRLFTRFFGEALVRGDPLVTAVARGRKGAFLDGTPDTVDWAFPVLFLDADLPAVCAPASRPAGQPDPGLRLAGRIQAYNVPRYPVFCGREEVFERYHQLFRSGEAQTLPIFSRANVQFPRSPGLGRTRVLKELAAQALRDGHIPCLVSSDEPGWPSPPFNGIGDLAAEILRAIIYTRKTFGLPRLLNSFVLRSIISAKNLADLKTRLDSVTAGSEFQGILDQARAAPGEGPSPATCGEALQEDFEALIKDARTAGLAGPESRVLLLLDDVDQYGKRVIVPLLHDVIKGSGLGTAAEPVPVILCYAKGTEQDGLFTEAKEAIGARELELKPFDDKTGEDLLALEQVLLSPDEADSFAAQCTGLLLSRLNKTIEGKVASFAINNKGVDKMIRDLWAMQFRLRFQGIPLNMKATEVYPIVIGACLQNFLVFGDDEARLRKLKDAT